MSSVFFADIPETEPIWKRAVGDSELEVRHVGPYVELLFPRRDHDRPPQHRCTARRVVQLPGRPRARPCGAVRQGRAAHRGQQRIVTAPTKRLGYRPRMEPGPMPDGVMTTVTAVKTADDASAPGVLYTVEGATTAVTLMHPRQDLARHHLIPALLEAGFAVWAQGSRTVNNDLTLVHEEAVWTPPQGLRSCATVVSSTSSPAARRAARRSTPFMSSRPAGHPKTASR